MFSIPRLAFLIPRLAFLWQTAEFSAGKLEQYVLEARWDARGHPQIVERRQWNK
jgi:hypothetical protein